MEENKTSGNKIDSYLSDKERKQMSEDVAELWRLSRIREQPYPQFDMMSYLQWDETNEKADMSFIAPKTNRTDVRANSGITHEKDNSLLSMLTGFNFEGKVRFFYKEQEMYDLGVSMTGWVRKTRELERYDEKRRLIYRNALVQGTVFVREKFVVQNIPEKIITGDIDYNNLEKIIWRNNGMRKVVEGATCYHVDGKKVYLGDIAEQDIRQQPFVYVVDYVDKKLIKSIFGKSKRFDCIPDTYAGGVLGGQFARGTVYSDATLNNNVDSHKWEIAEKFNRLSNTYQIYINGTPMLPEGFPLTAVSPSGYIPLAKGDIEPMNGFAYSKGIPAKTKFDQALYDAFIKILVLKSQQAAHVPSVNNTGKLLSSRIYDPAYMGEGFDANKIQKLIDQPGATTADFQLMNFIQEMINNKSINSILEGSGAGTSTLGEYMDRQKKAAVKIGGIFDGIINLEKQLLFLRVNNLLANGAIRTEKGSAKYSEVQYSDTFEDGTKGSRVIRFSEQNYITPDEVFAEELGYEKDKGTNIRISYLDPKELKKIISDPDWYIVYEIVPVDKNNDKLTQAMFVAMATQAANLFGIDQLSMDKLKKRYASVMNEEYEDLFVSDEEAQMKQMQAMSMGGGLPSPVGAIPNGARPGGDAVKMDNMYV